MEWPDTSREVTYSLAEHQILLSFNGDRDAEMFDVWWNEKGFDLFRSWAEQVKKDDEYWSR